ncbi:hypothetical protein HV782_003135 [Pseudomonas monsensis]|uniref:hypothetical protein n=1 Tax=Pseudomonas monsensis TaxID=2745509 RepID=UPI00164970C8|nr:hypothetical protein [Pseudomonas monsensis]QXI01010.1 hypothetical protein HV782_003135 [Pseudomonas monsensis]
MEDQFLLEAIEELMAAATYHDDATEDASRGEGKIFYRDRYHIDIKIKRNESQQTTPLKSLEDFIAEIDKHLDEDAEHTSTWTEQINNIYDSEPIPYAVSLYITDSEYSEDIEDIEEPS